MKKMKKQKVLLILVVFLTSAFRGSSPEATTASRTFGICNCEKDANAPRFDLTLNADNTFRYVNTVSGTAIDVTGTWQSTGKTIVLKDYPAGAKLHDKWKAESKKPCITSRKGMEFSRLCEQKCD